MACGLGTKKVCWGKGNEGEDLEGGRGSLCWVFFWGGRKWGEETRSWVLGEMAFLIFPFLMKLDVMGLRSLFLSFLAVAPLAAFGLNQKHKR